MEKSRNYTFAIISDSQQQIETGFTQLQLSADGFEELGQSLTKFSGIILDTDKRTIQDEFLYHLRRHASLCLKPVFLTSSLGASIDALADGIIAEYGKVVDLAKPILRRLESFGYDFEDVLNNPLFRVLLYVYSRNEAIIPIKNWTSPSLYTYPLVEALTGFSEHVDQWLNNQISRMLLEKNRLIDRVRCCPHCGLANPNYIDVCSNCRSIQIQQDTFLHCFTCGTVQPEKDFLTTSGSLTCPKCRERLRHIGTDYDRPLENYSCRDCQSSFSEPLIIAVCPRCETASDTEELEVKSYSRYTLTEKAVLAVQTGYLNEPANLIDDLQNVSFQHFRFQLDWFFAMASRYEEEIFTIFTVRLSNLDELEASLGSAGLFELIEEFVKRVRVSLRGTDFSSRGKKNDLWFILPKTDIRQRETVLRRIMDFVEDAKQVKNQVELKISAAALTVPTQINEHDTPEKILAMLENELDR